MSGFFDELQRRKVYRIAAAYVLIDACSFFRIAFWRWTWSRHRLCRWKYRFTRRDHARDLLQCAGIHASCLLDVPALLV